MADYYGVSATKAITPIMDNRLDPGVFGGKVRCMLDSFEAAGEVATKTIQVGQALPIGSRVIAVLVAFDDLSGAGATIDIGDADNDDRYASAIDVATAASYSVGTLVDGFCYKVLGTGLTAGGDDTKILITINTAAITGTLKAAILYVAE